MLAKHCLQEFKLDCQLRRLTERTIKGYYNNTLNFLNYAEKHHEVVEVALSLLAQGKTYSQITTMTGISKSTLIRAKNQGA